MKRIAIRSVRNKMLVEKRLEIRQRAVRHATGVTAFNYIACLTGHHLFQSFELWKRLMKNLANPENLIKIVVQTNNKIEN